MNALQRLERKINNALWERRLGISTHGVYRSDNSDDEHIYYGTNSYEAINAVLDYLAPGPEDVFVDLGCGKGRVVCLAALRTMKQVIGVDDSEELCALASRNADAMKHRAARITIVQKEAQKFDYTAGTVYYMFNPFGPASMQDVLRKMKEGIDSSPRKIRIAYSSPAQAPVLDRSGWLREYERWTTRSHPSIDDAISFWTNA